MTIHRPQNDEMAHRTHAAQPLAPDRPRSFRPLSTQNIFDYLRLLGWVLFRPALLKVYRIRCDVPQRQALRRQALWLIAHLIWGSVLLWIVVPLVMGVTPLNKFLAVFMMLSTFLVWRLTGKFGMRRETSMVNGLILGVALVAFGMITAVTLPFYETPTTTLPVIIMYVFVMVSSLIALPVASIFRLNTAEKIAGVMVVLAAGGLSTLVFDLMEAAWIPVSIIIIAVFLVGVVEDRYDMAKHNH